MPPSLFIGSSSESLDLAYAVQESLEDIAEVNVWTQGTFGLSKTYLEALLEALDANEYSIFVFAPDDVVRIRGSDLSTPRDNVIFELGLFIGRLGRERCYIIAPADVTDFHLPTDLLGLTVATFRPPSNPNRLVAALGPACNHIRREIQQVEGKRRADLNSATEHEAILALVLPQPERQHLANLFLKTTGGYEGNEPLRAELRHLRSIGLIRNVSGHTMGQLVDGGRFDLGTYVELTDQGRDWARTLQLTPD